MTIYCNKNALLGCVLPSYRTDPFVWCLRITTRCNRAGAGAMSYKLKTNRPSLPSLGQAVIASLEGRAVVFIS